MKKVLIGCGIVALLAMVMFVGCFIFVGVKANQWGKGIEASGKRLEVVEKSFPFTVPDDGVVAEDRLQSYLAARSAIHSNLREIKMIGEMATAVDEQRQPNITGGMVFSFLADLQKVMNGVAEGLEAHQISASEYGFIGRQMLAASLQDQDDAGSTADGVWAEIQKAVDSGQMRSSSGGSSNIDVELELERLRRELVPDANRELARRNASQLAPDRSTIIMELIFSSIMSEASRGMAVNVQKSGDGIMIDTGNNNPRDAELEEPVPAP